MTRNATYKLKAIEGLWSNSKLGVAYRGCISNANFHCRQRPMLKHRVLMRTEMNEC